MTLDWYRRSFIAKLGAGTAFTAGCIESPSRQPATHPSQEHPSIELFESDSIADEHGIRITPTVTVAQVTEDSPPRARVSTKNTGESRYLASMRSGLHFHPEYGGDTSDQPPGLVLRDATEDYVPTDGKWQFEPHEGGGGGAGLPGIVIDADETVSTDYLVLDDSTVGGYYSPGTYRFEAPVAVQPDVEKGPPSGTVAEFTWGFSLQLESE